MVCRDTAKRLHDKFLNNNVSCFRVMAWSAERSFCPTWTLIGAESLLPGCAGIPKTRDLKVTASDRLVHEAYD